MQLCYVDESGNAETLTRADADRQPIVVVAGVSFPEAHLTDITHEWIELKRSYLPAVRAMSRHGWLDGILKELKGATLRRGFRRTATTRQRKQAVGFLDGLVRLLERHECRIVGRVWVKQLDVAIDGMTLHVSSLRFICGAFHAGLERLLDMPVFGHSDNHAGLQLADLLCSALLAPIACATYASEHASWNRHCDPGFLVVRERYGARLARLAYTWRDREVRECPSLAVHDPLKRSANLMWAAPTPSYDVV